MNTAVIAEFYYYVEQRVLLYITRNKKTCLQTNSMVYDFSHAGSTKYNLNGFNEVF